MFKITCADPLNPEISLLIQQSNDFIQKLYCDEENHSLSLSELCKSNIIFFCATKKNLHIGCAALALRDGYGELKSLFVHPDHRNQGIGLGLINALEQEARKHKLEVIYLETGVLLSEAVSLYKKIGFMSCGPFGDYTDEATSLFFVKALNVDQKYTIINK